MIMRSKLRNEFEQVRQLLRRKGRTVVLLLLLTATLSLLLLSNSEQEALTETTGEFKYDTTGCGCPRYYHQSADSSPNKSLCGADATARGSGQKVVSYIIYGSLSDPQKYRQYWGQLEDRVKDVKRQYPGWLMRLYHNTTVREVAERKLLCDLYCNYSHLDLCFTPNIYPPPKRKINPNEKMSKTDFSSEFSEVLNNLVYNPKHIRKSYADILIPRMWRYMPMADPTVSDFLSRDVDSVILDREVAAVHQWLDDTNSLVHAMRDHPSHNGVMLAGMWGASRRRGAELLTHLFYKIARWPPRNFWDYDQILLHRVVWPDVRDTIIIHDSYFCRIKRFCGKKKSLPFPTKRNGTEFVSWGKLRDPERVGIRFCPMACRPEKHKDWLYC